MDLKFKLYSDDDGQFLIVSGDIYPGTVARCKLDDKKFKSCGQDLRFEMEQKWKPVRWINLVIKLQ